MRKVIALGIVICAAFLVGCSSKEVLESEQEVILSQETLFSDLRNELIASITEQTELKSESLAIMIDGGVDEYTVSVGFPEAADVDGEMVQQLVEESIQNISDNEAASEEKIKMKIKVENY